MKRASRQDAPNFPSLHSQEKTNDRAGKHNLTVLNIEHYKQICFGQLNVEHSGPNFLEDPIITPYKHWTNTFPQLHSK